LSEEIIAKILRVLRESKHDLSVGEIADLADIHRNTVGKYLFTLEREGKVMVTRAIGRAKLYSLAK
jgi:DNA-binding IclR family transcriptional regulator